MLSAAALLSGAALVPPRRLPIRVAATIVDYRFELAVSGLITAIACAVAFILMYQA